MLRTVWLLNPVDDTSPLPASEAGVGGCALPPQVPAQWPVAAACSLSDADPAVPIRSRAAVSASPTHAHANTTIRRLARANGTRTRSPNPSHTATTRLWTLTITGATS